MRGYGKQAHEFNDMWMRVVDLIQKMCGQLERDQVVAQESIYQFGLIVFHFIRLKKVCSASRVFDRLAASTSIVSRPRDFHTELTFLKRHANLDSLTGDWDSRCTSDERALLKQFRENIEKMGLLSSQQPEDNDDRAEVAVLLQHSLRVHGDKYSEVLLSLLRLSLAKVTRSSEDHDSPTNPNWFIPPHELDVEDCKGG